MNCMKCGKNIPDGQVFCPDCLAGMAAYPVKPGTVVQLPIRPAASTRKAPGKWKESPAAQLERVKRKLHRRAVILVILAILVPLMAAGGFLAGIYWERRDSQNQLGQNYSTSDSSQPEDNTNVSRETFQ